MSKIQKFVTQLAAAANRLSGLIAGLFILATAFIITYEVILRALFNAPTEWVNEVSVYLLIVSAFFALAPALAAGKHISVDLVTSKLPPKTNRLLELAVSALGLAFSLVFLVTSAEMALNAYRLNMLSVSTLRIPIYIPQMALPIGFFLLGLQFLANLLNGIALVSGKEDAL